MPYKVITPMFYTSSAGDRGVFSKRTGASKPLVEVNTDNITILPFFEGVGQFTDRFVIKARLLSLGGSSFSIPTRYYPYSNKLTISGFASNINFILQIRIVETKTINDKNLAINGERFKLARNGSINQFRFRYPTVIDSPGIAPQITTASSEDLLDLPGGFVQVIKPRDSVF